MGSFFGYSWDTFNWVTVVACYKISGHSIKEMHNWNYYSSQLPVHKNIYVELCCKVHDFLFCLQIRGSKSKALHDKVLVNCQYSMATFSTGERKRRPRGDRKSKEMTMHLQQTFDAAIITNLHPRSQIDIFVEVNHRPCFLKCIFWCSITMYIIHQFNNFTHRFVLLKSTGTYPAHSLNEQQFLKNNNVSVQKNMNWNDFICQNI